MKRTTIWAVAAGAALVMTAVIGVASASAATVICNKQVTACPNESVAAAGAQSILGVSPASEGHFTIRGLGGPVECESALIISTSTKKWGNPLEGQSKFQVYAKNCATYAFLENSKPCESLTFNEPKATFEATGGGDGIINIGSKSEPLTISSACWSPLYNEVVECTVKADSAIPIHSYNGGEGTILKSEATLTKVSGSNCAATGSMDAELESGGYNTYISTNTATVLCGQAVSVCPNGSVLPAGGPTGHVAVGKDPNWGKFRIGLGNASIKCDYAVIDAISTAEAGTPLLGESKFQVYPQNCRISWLSKSTENCKSLTFNSPGVMFEPIGSGQGIISIGSKAEPLTVSFNCYSPLFSANAECTYKANSSILIHPNGWEARIKPEEATTTLVSGNEFCGSTGALDAELEYAAGGAISTI